MAKNQDKKKAWSDTLKSVMPIVVPYAARFIVGLVPPGSKVDEFFSKYRSYWEKAAPLVSTMVLQLTNMPDFVDDIVAELSAEVARTIKEKYSDGEVIKDGSKPEAKTDYPISFAMSGLPKEDFVKFTELLGALEDKQRNRVLCLELGGKENTKTLINLLASLSTDEFKAWAAIMAPLPKPHAKTEFEKKIGEGWDGFNNDAKGFFQKDSYFVKLAKSKGLM